MTTYDQNFWDERYSGSAYFYGIHANAFLMTHVHELRGPVLSLCEGEGRNAVFMAERGLAVLGVDSSHVGLTKAHALAASKGVRIETRVADMANFEPEKNYFGSVVSIFAHLPTSIRATLYPRIEEALKPGGLLLLEAYSKNQLSKNTGGPKDIDMLMSVETLRAAFPRLKPLLLHEIERDVNEGAGHTGLASVVQFIAQKI
jgi:SAM-dependent methyltransferase